ncbi:DUF1127 domain-containing protein [Pseudomonas sp. MNR3A]|uniref:DUF1127 domain-containing protein n=1 Tax=Pseudomonas sp. MNR3A TaxID=2615213 RepID=UPI00129BEC42|nr:DUF1127 domain-containing protein [Pseudomonas sp. MNR3A]
MNGLSDVRLQLLAEELRAGQWPKVSSAPVGLGRLGLMVHRWRSRKVLRELSDHQLLDIGISRQQAREEGCKPFWRA